MLISRWKLTCGRESLTVGEAIQFLPILVHCIFPLGQYILNIRKTWEKLLLAARAIAAIENPADVCVIASRPYAQRAILKFAAHTGATPVAGRFTPGMSHA